MKTETDPCWIQPAVRAMHPYTPGAQPEGGGIVKLNTNENPYPPSPAVREALRMFDPADLRRYPDPECRALRTALAAGHGCRAEQVFVGNGSDEILSLATRAFVADGGAIGYFEPSYSLYPVLADARGASRRPTALDAAFGWRDPPVGDTALFFLAWPNAPTGKIFDRTTVTEFCRRFPGVVLLDQAYVDFARETLDDLALERPNVLSVRTFSKSYSLAGLRVGYALGPAPLIRALDTLKDSYNVDRIAQTLALAAVGDRAWMRSNAAKIRATRQRLTRELRALGWCMEDSQANFVWARPPGGNAAGLFSALCAEQIFVRHFPGDRTGDFLRITIGTDAEIDRLLDALRKDAS